MRDFKELKVWQKSHRLTVAVYECTAAFPRHQLYSLTGQMQRASSSVPANIAEGCGRNTVAEFGRFLHIAMGSASELEYFLILSKDLGYLDTALHEQLDKDVIEVKRMLASLIQRLKE